MAIPEGYRLLTAEDVGKTFGVELEDIVYFKNVYPNLPDTSINAVQFNNITFIQMYSDSIYRYNYGSPGNMYKIFMPNAWFDSSESVTEVLKGVDVPTIVSISDWFAENNNWFYVKDIKVIVTKSKITNLANKVRAKAGTSINYTIDAMAAAVENLQIGEIIEEWDGTIIEGPEGYTLTLMHAYMSASSYINNPIYYSIDSGSTWVQLTADILTSNIQLILNSVSKIRFKVSSESQLARFIGTSEGGSDVISYLHGTETDDIEITQDTTLYIGVTTTN